MEDQREVIVMPYFLETDTFADDDVWVELARLGGGKWGGALYNLLKASYCDLKAKASHVMSDGWLNEQRALHYCRGRRSALDLLCTPVLGRPPLLHRRGEECACLPGDWIEGYDFYIHAFLKRNPSRAEVKRNKAQKADLDNARLKNEVYQRDGGCCRYCRSGPINPKTNDKVKDRRRRLHFDHVDPDEPATPEGGNFVTACARCNEYKGARTPQEAGMVLLGEPTTEERQAWLSRPVAALHERSDWGPEHAQGATPEAAQIIPGSSPDHVSDHPPDHRPTNDATNDRSHDPLTDSWLESTGAVRPDSAGHSPDHGPNATAKGPGMGRVGEPHETAHDPTLRSPPRQPSGAQPVRTSTHPDIYHRRSRGPAPPELPPLLWPPGSSTERPRPARPSEEET